MGIKYICRHCRTTIGELPDGAVSEAGLGLLFLTPEEREDIISYDSGGMTVKVVCDYCKQALEQHPELSLLANPLQ